MRRLSRSGRVGGQIGDRQSAARRRMVAASSITSSRAAESVSWRVTSSAVSAGLTGVTAAPTRHAANSATTNSTRLRSLSATTSPGPIPVPLN